MSQNTFNINDIYKDAAPRKQVDFSDRTIWDTVAQVNFSVQPQITDPKFAKYVSELRVHPKSPVFAKSVATDPFLTITYPTYEGDVNVTRDVIDVDELLEMSEPPITISSENVYIVKFEPAIKLLGSNTESEFLLNKHANVSSWTSGSISFITKGWTLKEVDL